MSNAQLKTYLPVFADPDIYRSLIERDYELFATPLQPVFAYERIGLDRLLAIRNDLDQLGILPPCSILDVGCNTGLFSAGLASVGYKVLGVDNNIVTEAQDFYPHPPLELAERTRAMLGLAVPQLDFRAIDIGDFLDQDGRTFDGCLLLSVVHQWFQGYAETGIGRLSTDVIRARLTALARRIRRVIYYEGPDDAATHAQLPLPAWFSELGRNVRIEPIAFSPAANGELRTVYRILLETQAAS